MSIDTVAVTGGNGWIGRAILSELSEQGYEAVNLARGKQREEVSDDYLTTDLLDAGEVYGSLAKCDADAVIHMGTIPGPTSHPEHVTYESNVMTASHVLTAGTSLGLESICLPSSVNALGSAHQKAPADIESLPVDEEHPRTPRDEYGIAKHAMEVTADGYGRRDRTDATISSLRYPAVMGSDELEEQFAESDRTPPALDEASEHNTRDVCFSYLHVDDAATAARAAIEADYDGHETFWIVAADTTADVPSNQLVERYYPDAEVRREFDEYESLIDISRARELLDWTPQHTWR